MNTLAVKDNYLVIGNCKVSQDEKNLWLYKISENSMALIDSLNLQQKNGRKNLFTFKVEILKNDSESSLKVYASTQAGIIWEVPILENSFGSTESIELSSEQGHAIALRKDKLAAIANNICLVKVE